MLLLLQILLKKTRYPMKKIMILVLILVTTFLAADFDIVGNRGALTINADVEITQEEVKLENITYIKLICEDANLSGKVGEPLLPSYTQLVELPNSGNYQIINLEFETEIVVLDHKLLPSGELKDFNDNYFRNNNFLPNQIATVGKPAIMRGVRFSQIAINPVQYSPSTNEIKIIKNISFDLEMDETDDRNRLDRRDNRNSKSFGNILKSNIYGFEPDRNLEVKPELYLFIGPDSIIPEIDDLVNLKHQLGFDTVVAGLSETGSSKAEIKDYIQNAYDNWESAPDYVVFIGDESGSISVESYFITGYLSPNDVTDHPYSLLDGDDYFPDVMIGRISVRNLSELHTVIQKILLYQMDPIIDVDWFDRAIALSVIEQWGGYFSGRETVMAARKKLLDFTYTEVDTFISPYQTSTTQLLNLINEGSTFINYRGFGSPSYWSGGTGSMMTINDIGNLNNGSMMPMVTSIVCGGGNFASNDYQTCFGEKWVNAGSPSMPKGAIAFIGPSEHDTKTQFNNTNDLGIYNAIAYESVYGTAEMMLAGKMALYNSYPNGHEMDGNSDALDSDQFYFHVFNLLGDPGLKIWTDNPKNMEITILNEIDAATNYLDIQLTGDDIEGSIISLTSDNDLVTTAKADANGNAQLVFPYLAEGTYLITASKYGFLPEQIAVEITDSSQFTIDSISQIEFATGTTSSVQIGIFNKTTSAISNCEVSVSCEDDYVTVESSPVTIDIEAGAITYFDAQINLDDTWRNNEVINLHIELNYEGQDFYFIQQIVVLSPELTLSGFEVNNSDNILIQSESNMFTLEFTNTGNLATENLSIEIEDSSGNSMMSIATIDYQTIDIGNSSMGDGYYITLINDDVVSGDILQLHADIYQSDSIVSTTSFNVPVGEITEMSPTFGTGGYYAIESSDQGNFDAPVYDWQAIAPEEGGAGQEIDFVHQTCDGGVGWFDLPFDFTYFGISYDTITASTEGYISMGKDELVFFRNRTIPSGVGPNSMIAPFWDNLRNGDIYSYYDEEKHFFVVTWYQFVNNYSYTQETFQVILFDPTYYNSVSDNGMIMFQYDTINNCDASENFATVGIENYTQTNGLLISYSNIDADTFGGLGNGKAILITCGDIVPLDHENNETDQAEVNLKNYPNPLILGSGLSSTNISFNLRNINPNKLQLEIYNVKGQKVWQQKVEIIDNQNYNITWNGKDFSGKSIASGIYLYKLQADQKVLDTQKMLILK